MSMKKTDLVKNLAARIDGQMRGTGVPGRFAQGSVNLSSRRDQRRADAAAGLVPFACKLPSELAQRLNERAATVDGGMNAWVAQALNKALE
jgi:hypothetical protein